MANAPSEAHALLSRKGLFISERDNVSFIPPSGSGGPSNILGLFSDFNDVPTGSLFYRLKTQRIVTSSIEGGESCGH